MILTLSLSELHTLNKEGEVHVHIRHKQLQLASGSKDNLLEARGVNQLHILIDLEEWPTASLTIKVRNTMNQYMLKDNRTVERGRERKGGRGRGREKEEQGEGGETERERVPKVLHNMYY